jgi:Amt family ammonium transporter
MAMVGGILMALLTGRNDPGFVHNGALAGLVAVCAGSDVMHPIGALVTGGFAGGLFVWAFNMCQNKWKIDDVLGVWALHGLCGFSGGILCGVFGQEALGGLGGVSLPAQIVGTLLGALIGLLAGMGVYGALKVTMGIRLDQDQEFAGADLSIHQITAYPEEMAGVHDDSVAIAAHISSSAARRSAQTSLSSLARDNHCRGLFFPRTAPLW